MKKKPVLSVLCLVILALSLVTRAVWAGGSEATEAPSEALEILENNYQIGPGDALEISVWKDESLSKE
ncbi:MAG: hypothetical protein ACOWYE_18730, partial [Desulfatiglandales bacterium]